MTGQGRESGEHGGDVGVTHYVVALREALRGASTSLTTAETGRDAETADRRRRRDEAAINSAADPILARCAAPLLAYCDELASGVPPVPGRARIDGADLAQEAWARVLRYLRGANGDRITDDLHLARFLRCAARNCLYDLLGSAPIVAEANSVALDAPESSGGPDGGGNGNGTERRVERIPAPASLPDILRFAGSGAYSSLIEALFTDEAAFRRSIHEAGARRHPRQYRALVLYQLGLFLWQETRGAPPEAVRETGRLLRHFVQALGVPVAWWEAVETAVHSTAWEALDDERDNPTDNGDVYSERTASEAATTALLAAVNHVCGASLKAGNMLSVLRYDLNQSVAGGGGGG